MFGINCVHSFSFGILDVGAATQEDEIRDGIRKDKKLDEKRDLFPVKDFIFSLNTSSSS